MKPGSIVLFHNAAQNTPEALPTILETLQGEGYRIVPVSDLIMKENFRIDPTGKQIAAEPESAPPPAGETAETPGASTKSAEN